LINGTVGRARDAARHIIRAQCGPTLRVQTNIFVTETCSLTNNKAERMVANEAELRGLMRAGLRGDAAAYRTLLGRLSQSPRLLQR
jgi:hypothetical protein